jgi:uracil-DNA glycosylase
MRILTIESIPGFSDWRWQARHAIQAGLTPGQVMWRTGDQPPSLLSLVPPFVPSAGSRASEYGKLGMQQLVTAQAERTSLQAKVPKQFLELAKLAACHHDPQRFNLLYRVLWRLLHENRDLLAWQTDNDVLALNAMVKAVNRDAYKIKAFLRFRTHAYPAMLAEMGDEQMLRLGESSSDGVALQPESEHFIAWYEPEHFTLELVLSFFQTRFANMRCSILTPYRAAHWDGETVTLTDESDRALVPQTDALEPAWLRYYANIFNPARLKTKAMLSHMPRKYWKNMPETALIDTMLREAPHRLRRMLESQQAVGINRTQSNGA